MRITRAASFFPDITGLDFQPDGKRVAVISTDKTLRTFAAADGKDEWKHTFGDQPGHLAYSPDGNYLAAGTDDSLLFVANLRTNSQ